MSVRNINNDPVLLGRIADGDPQAFESLYRQFRSTTFSIALHFVKSPFGAEEVTQEVYVGVWISRAGLRDVENIEAYLYTSTFNKAVQYLKKQKNQEEVMVWAADQGEDQHNVTEELVTYREISRSLQAAIEQLPPQKKIIYRLNKEQGLSYKDIADKLNISPHTVKNHLVETMKILKQSLRHFPASAAFIEITRIFFSGR
ncbi:MAG: RNA polymerase sigma-70 factor [Candidatus Pseudobacter hemicellulosilyticus]|uniref:RNA polymerase sigma-70 factor n=1 Tax=Candidatus Pseudobacter hemicellulosilyticus TaxID=3121375 RepID=A0AAJ5WQJ6_9BACT|nr:MAG: RNA polymerase sigma-70 factor [Pseudobacter sp.]